MFKHLSSIVIVAIIVIFFTPFTLGSSRCRRLIRPGVHHPIIYELSICSETFVNFFISLHHCSCYYWVCIRDYIDFWGIFKVIKGINQPFFLVLFGHFHGMVKQLLQSRVKALIGQISTHVRPASDLGTPFDGAREYDMEHVCEVPSRRIPSHSDCIWVYIQLLQFYNFLA